MSRSNDPVPVGTRLQLVLAVPAHEMTVAQAARRHAVPAESVNRWRNWFAGAGKAAMEDGMPGKAGVPRQPGRATAARGDPRSVTAQILAGSVPAGRHYLHAAGRAGDRGTGSEG